MSDTLIGHLEFEDRELFVTTFRTSWYPTERHVCIYNKELNGKVKTVHQIVFDENGDVIKLYKRDIQSFDVLIKLYNSGKVSSVRKFEKDPNSTYLVSKASTGEWSKRLDGLEYVKK